MCMAGDVMGIKSPMVVETAVGVMEKARAAEAGAAWPAPAGSYTALAPCRTHKEDSGGHEHDCTRGKASHYRAQDRPGTIVWEKSLNRVLPERRAPRAYVVRAKQRGQRGGPGRDHALKMLLVSPLPLGSGPDEWLLSKELRSMGVGLPYLWHEARPRAKNDAVMSHAIVATVEMAFRAYCEDRANVDPHALWERTMWAADYPAALPDFLRRT